MLSWRNAATLKVQYLQYFWEGAVIGKRDDYSFKQKKRKRQKQKQESKPVFSYGLSLRECLEMATAVRRQAL